MKKIILTVGAPGSGKTTWATEQVRTRPGYINLNRDDFRASLVAHQRGGKRPSKTDEKVVTQAQIAAATDLLKANFCKAVIISDTNLNPKTRETWKKLAKELKAEYSESHFVQPYKELLKRNLHRGQDAVPVHVIRDFYMKMREYVGAYRYIPDESLPKAIIFDLDGTLAIHNGRGPHDLEKLGTDLPNRMVVEYAKMAKKLGYAVITVSGRESGTKESPMCYYGATIDWMNQQDVPWETHIQRKQGDSRSDDIVKLEIFRDKIAPHYNVCLAVDDRQQVVDMWRSIGVECWQVQYGDF